MATIPIFKVGNRRLQPESLREMAGSIKLQGEIVRSDQSLALYDRTQALVYAQPGARLAGLLFYTDQSRNMAARVEGLIDEKQAQSWSVEFLKRFGFDPPPPREKRFPVEFETYSYTSIAIDFDGKERTKRPMGVEVASRIRLNDIPVIGPRAKVRIFFKDQDRPIWMHCCTWSSLVMVAEKELIREHDVLRLARERLQDRRRAAVAYTIASMNLVYYLGEYSGGPDLLLPYYFIEMEFNPTRGKEGEERSISQGPRQLIKIPATL